MARYQYVIHSCAFMSLVLQIATAHVNCLSVLALRSASEPGRASIREVLCAREPKPESTLLYVVERGEDMEGRLVAGERI